MKTTEKMFCTAVCTLFYGCIIGVILFLMLKDEAFTIYPLIVAPFPVLMYRLFQRDIKVNVKFLLISLGCVIVIGAIDILIYYIHTVTVHGEDMTYFILWKDLVCFICATSLLNLSFLIPVIRNNRLSNVMVCMAYALFTIIAFVLSTLIYFLMEAVSDSALYILVAAALVFLIVSVLCVHRRSKVIDGDKM